AQTGIAHAHVVLEIPTIECAEGGNLRVPLRSTERLPEASGAAWVERKGGTTEIEIRLDSMKPASLFGGDYNTYALWVVPPGGRPENLGEIRLDGSQARLHVSTSAAEFAIAVTAEPHYLVDAPSAFVIFANAPVANTRKIQLSLIAGVYNFSRSTLE